MLSCGIMLLTLGLHISRTSGDVYLKKSPLVYVAISKCFLSVYCYHELSLINTSDFWDFWKKIPSYYHKNMKDINELIKINHSISDTVTPTLCLVFLHFLGILSLNTSSSENSL